LSVTVRLITAQSLVVRVGYELNSE